MAPMIHKKTLMAAKPQTNDIRRPNFSMPNKTKMAVAITCCESALAKSAQNLVEQTLTTPYTPDASMEVLEPEIPILLKMVGA